MSQSWATPESEIKERTRKGTETLYVTDAEMIRRSGVPRDWMYKILPELETKHGFPRKNSLFKERRYWPAVKQWFDKFHENAGRPAGVKRGDRP